MSKKPIGFSEGGRELEAYVERMNATLVKLLQNDRPPVFSIDRPASLTIKKRGSFSKRPFLGGEPIRLQSTYLGKTLRVIWVFELLESRGETVEILGEDVRSHVAGFGQWLNNQQDSDDDLVRAAARETAEGAELAAHNAALTQIYTDDSRFGSW